MHSIQRSFLNLAIGQPESIIIVMLLITVALAALMIRIDVDTDPENMLPSHDPVRVLNRSLRADFGTRDMIVLGIIEYAGVLNTETLGKAARLIRGLESFEGVVPGETVSFLSATNVPDGDLNGEDVARIVGAVDDNPVLASKVFSAHGNALAVYVPLVDKADAKEVASAIRGLIVTSGLNGVGEHQLGGLPLAEESFGRDMFIQMGILAPIAGLVIFILMYFFFRKLSLVLAAMITGNGERHLGDGAFDRHRFHPAYHELNDPGFSDADRHPGQHPHPE